MRTRLSLVVLTVVLWLPLAAAEVGEFEIPPVSPLVEGQLARLRQLCRRDPEARALATTARDQATPFLDDDPRPLEVIHYEGLVNTDPRRIASVENLRDMTKAALLGRYWQAFGDDRAAASLRRFILAWADTYKLTGNDVNENKFYPLLVAYHGLRPSFPTAARRQVDGWVSDLGKLHQRAVRKSERFTNRYNKSVRLLAICGMILDRPAWIAAAHEGIKRFVSQSLFADGTSHDLRRRDTLTYHGSALKPVLELAQLAGEDGRKLYSWTAPQTGGSLQKAVDYVVPYAMGEKTRREWTNSKVELDRRRAEAGLEYYRAGRLYDPQNALELMERASYFDPGLMRVVRHLTKTEAKRFPTWQTLVNAARRGHRE